MKVAVLGTGAMGTGVARSLRFYEGVTGTVAMDPRVDAFGGLSDLPEIETTTDLNRVLSDPEIKLVFITASNDMHPSLAIAALEAGKSVMCEKPMANSLADATAMVEAAERNNAFLQIGFELRYSLLYVQIKKWIDAGLLGEIVSVRCNYSDQR